MRIQSLCRGALAVAASVCSILVTAAETEPWPAPGAAPAAGPYRHFKAAIYIPVNVTRGLAGPWIFEQQFARGMSRIDKVYIEAYRDRQFASDAELETVKKQFQARGVVIDSLRDTATTVNVVRHLVWNAGQTTG
jgi:hypothetical protein